MMDGIGGGDIRHSLETGSKQWVDLALQVILFCLMKTDISGLSFREPLYYNTEGTWVSVRPGTWRRTMKDGVPTHSENQNGCPPHLHGEGFKAFSMFRETE